MVEYSFDNSLLNSHNSKRISQIASQNVSGKESLHKLSVFSESQSFQNFIRRKAQNYDEKDNIYIKRYDFGREHETQESYSDTKKMLDKMKTATGDEEQQQIADAKLNIYKTLHKKPDNISPSCEINNKTKTRLFFDCEKIKEPIIQNKSDVFMKKKQVVDPKSVKINISNSKTFPKVNKPHGISVKNKALMPVDIFSCRKNSQTSLKEYSSHITNTNNSNKRIEKPRNNHEAYSMRDLPHHHFNFNSISIDKPHKTLTKSTKQRNLSTNLTFNVPFKSYCRTKASPSKEKTLLRLNNTSIRDKESKRLVPIEPNNHDGKVKYYISLNRDVSAIDKSKEKLQKSLNKMQKYRKLKQDYIQKLINDSKSLTKHYKTFSSIGLPSEEVYKTNSKKSALIECTEYKGDIKSLFDHSSSNNTTGKSIDNLESLVKRICNKTKNK